MAVRRYAGTPLPFNENICAFACTGGLFVVSLHVDRMGISRHLRMSKEFDWNFQRNSIGIFRDFTANEQRILLVFSVNAQRTKNT